MSYRFMRILIMFDLPVETKAQVRVYNKFRKQLIKEGFLMLQYSIYIKTCINREAANGTINIIKKYLPKNGHIRSLIITEKQYENMIVLLGEEDKNIEILGDNRTIMF